MREVREVRSSTWWGSSSNSVKRSLILWPGVVENTQTHSCGGVGVRLRVKIRWKVHGHILKM